MQARLASRRDPGGLPRATAALRERQAEGEGGVPTTRDHLEPALHAQRELISDREPEARATGGVARVEAVEDLLDRAGVDALLGVIADDQLRGAVLADSGDRHVRSLRRMGDRIVDENTDDL